MGIDQLDFQSVQLGYLKILQMGNTDPNNTKAGKEHEVKPQAQFVPQISYSTSTDLTRARQLQPSQIRFFTGLDNHRRNCLELKSISSEELKNSRSIFKKKKKRRWSWNKEVQHQATVGFQQMRRDARYGMSCDDISLDVITISSWLSADEAKRERLCVVISADEATVTSRNAKITSRKMNSRRKQQQHPVESLFESAVANQPVASFAYSVDLVPRRKELKKEQSAAVVGINQQRSS
ncbi:U-box domain-containing protein 50 [Dorcoceras hygrometricum]|uniref:U-box domain-containing protein 50 n=1 Tax=Dorcoceras hygrometricum TaxID=472368 RepID=A0A2Z7A259_9LAMI|nr:U-box domain-containing protein 50 [Dorcoceras hygrometricum]